MTSHRKTEWQTIDEDIPDDTRMHEVSGLKPGATYKFRVVAVYSNNDNNHGPNSLRFMLQVAPEHRPNRPIDGPVIVEARPTSVNSIMIRWQVSVHCPLEQLKSEHVFLIMMVIKRQMYSNSDFIFSTYLSTSRRLKVSMFPTSHTTRCRIFRGTQ